MGRKDIGGSSATHRAAAEKAVRKRKARPVAHGASIDNVPKPIGNRRTSPEDM